LLAGQVKYWNQFETYIPTPFPTEDYASYPHDYFYVTLRVIGVNNDTIEAETVKVEPHQQPDHIKLLSYLELTVPVGTTGHHTRLLWGI